MKKIISKIKKGVCYATLAGLIISGSSCVSYVPTRDPYSYERGRSKGKQEQKEEQDKTRERRARNSAVISEDTIEKIIGHIIDINKFN